MFSPTRKKKDPVTEAQLVVHMEREGVSRQFNCEANLNTVKVQDVLQQVEVEWAMEPGAQRLLLDQRELARGDILRHAGVENGATLTLVAGDQGAAAGPRSPALLDEDGVPQRTPGRKAKRPTDQRKADELAALERQESDILDQISGLDEGLIHSDSSFLD